MVDPRFTTATETDDVIEHPIVPARTTGAGHATIEEWIEAIDVYRTNNTTAEFENARFLNQQDYEIIACVG